MFKLILILFCIFDISLSLDICEDWTQYKDTKCVKIIEGEVTQKEAIKKCRELDNNSSLITIHNKEEQQFFNQLLKKYNNKSQNAWIGMESKQWIDGTESDYSNWSEYADREKECVQMSLICGMRGQWMDTKCEKKALTVCQKEPEFSLRRFKELIEQQNELSNVMEVLKQIIQDVHVENFNLNDNYLPNNYDKRSIEFNAKTEELEKQIKSLIPLGFLYTQLPNQTSPQELWPNMKWTEVTNQYSGLFFRAEGSGSETFGQIQQANQSRISDIGIFGVFFDSLFESENQSNYSSIALGYDSKWSSVYSEIPDIGYNRLINHLSVYTTGGEVRPKNTAIRIWKRIQ